jgi:hypothetical protein
MPEPGNTPDPSSADTNQKVVLMPEKIPETKTTPPAIEQPTETVPKTVEPGSTFSYSPENDSQNPISEGTNNNKNSKSIAWSASEFTAHEKSTRWYSMLVLFTTGIAFFLLLISRSIVTFGVVIVGGMTIGVYSRRKPRQIDYILNTNGIQVGTKQYLYDEFQLFILIPESSVHEVSLIPVKCFMPPLSLIYATEDEEKILNMLADYLPSEERRPDLIDSIMRKIHF